MSTTWLTSRQLAERLHVTPKTLRNWRLNGLGPNGVKIGRQVLTREEEVERWERAQEAASGGS
jgi:hypothetical protein